MLNIGHLDMSCWLMLTDVQRFSFFKPVSSLFLGVSYLFYPMLTICAWHQWVGLVVGAFLRVTCKKKLANSYHILNADLSRLQEHIILKVHYKKFKTVVVYGLLTSSQKVSFKKKNNASVIML